MPIAEKFIAEAKAQGEDSPRMAFLIVTEKRLWSIPDFFQLGKVQNFTASSNPLELSAHQMSVRREFGSPPFTWQGRKTSRLPRQMVVPAELRRVVHAERQVPHGQNFDDTRTDQLRKGG